MGVENKLTFRRRPVRLCSQRASEVFANILLLRYLIRMEGYAEVRELLGAEAARKLQKLRAGVAEIMTATGWPSHTVRGAMSGALKKKLGLEVTSEKVEDRGRVYKIAS